MLLYLLVMFNFYLYGKILSFIFKDNYMFVYDKMKTDLIDWLVS